MSGLKKSKPMKPTNLTLPPELQAALSTIATNGHDPIAPSQPSLTQSALDWQKARLRQPIPAQVMDYEQAVAIFYGYWKNRVPEGKAFYIHPENEVHVSDLVKWAIFDPTSSIPLNKSIWLYGLVGAGKSIFAKTMHDFFCWIHEFVNSRVNFGYCDMNILIDKAKFDYSEMKALNVAKSLIIDELKESQQQIILPYGIRFRIGDLVTNLYSVWQERNTRTIVTTNLPPAPGGIFDDREFDRMVEMFSSVNWHGGSLRKSK